LLEKKVGNTYEIESRKEGLVHTHFSGMNSETVIWDQLTEALRSVKKVYSKKLKFANLIT